MELYQKLIKFDNNATDTQGFVFLYEWVKEAAAEHNMKPEKYIKIMFSL